MITRYTVTTTELMTAQRLVVIDLDLLRDITALRMTGEAAEKEIAGRLSQDEPRMKLALVAIEMTDETPSLVDDEAVDFLEQLGGRLEECQGNGPATRLLRSFTTEAKALLARARAPQETDTAA